MALRLGWRIRSRRVEGRVRPRVARRRRRGFEFRPRVDHPAGAPLDDGSYLIGRLRAGQRGKRLVDVRTRRRLGANGEDTLRLRRSRDVVPRRTAGRAAVPEGR